MREHPRAARGELTSRQEGAGRAPAPGRTRARTPVREPLTERPEVAPGHLHATVWTPVIAGKLEGDPPLNLTPLPPIQPLAVASLQPQATEPLARPIVPLDPITAIEIAPLSPPDGRE